MSRLARLQRYIEHREDLTYLEGLLKQKAKVDDIVKAMDTEFGNVLINALKALERSAIEDILKSRTRRAFLQARAEVKTARYLLGVLNAYRSEQESLQHAINEMEEYNG